MGMSGVTARSETSVSHILLTCASSLGALSSYASPSPSPACPKAAPLSRAGRWPWCSLRHLKGLVGSALVTGH
jgi:hypothetical protein